jgi:hypothetical protein
VKDMTTMATLTGDRIPLADLKGIVARALAPGDYAHATGWIDGHPAEVDTPAAHMVNLDILTADLTPDDSGTVDKAEAASAILRVIEERLLPHPYTLRAHSLVKRLTEEAERYEGLAGTPSPDDRQQDTAEWMPVCQWRGCGQRCKSRQARYCKPSHRNAAYKARKREQG